VTAFIFQFTTCDIILKVFYDISEFLFWKKNPWHKLFWSHL
jgi:hypothetical protein